MQSFYNRLLLVFVPSVLALVTVMGIIVNQDLANETNTIFVQEEDHVESLEHTVTDTFDSVLSDLLLLAENPQLVTFLTTEDPGTRVEISGQFLNVSFHRRLYDQIRYLDAAGNEVIRINFEDGDPEIVREDRLTNKADREYFTRTMELNRGEIFVSQLDLNEEDGVIDEPFKPTLRVSTPVFNYSGQQTGVVVLNYLGEIMYEQIDDTIGQTESDTLLINDEGYLLKGPDASQLWGFQISERQDATFDNIYPETAALIAEGGNEGQIQTSEGLFSYTTIYPLREAAARAPDYVRNADNPSNIDDSSYTWLLVSRVPPDVLSPWNLVNLAGYLALGIFLVIGLFVASVFIARLLVQRQENLAEIESQNERLEEQVLARTAKLRHANEEMVNFTSIVSHDLRSPIASVRGFLKEVRLDWDSLVPALERCETSTKERMIYEQYIPEAFDLMDSSLSQMERLSGGILGLSKEGRRVMKPQTIDVEAMLRTVLTNYTHSIREHNIRVDVQRPLPEVVADPLAFEQVFSNIIGNAVKYRDEVRPCSIRIRAEDSDTHTIFHVIDNGRGIAESDQENVFRLFRRGNVQQIEGEGFGLYYTRALVRRHGGEMWFSSKLGEGSTFSFSIAKSIENEQLESEEALYA